MARFFSTLICLAVIAGALYFAANTRVFPGILQSERFGLHKYQPPPLDVEPFMLATEDGIELEAWRMERKGEGTSRRVAVLFPDEDGSLNTAVHLMRWLAARGFTVYGVNHRGFGKSRGWPSESALLQDALVAFERIASREGIGTEGITVFGVALGGALAIHTAASFPVKALVLFGAYSSLEDVARHKIELVPARPWLRKLFVTPPELASTRAPCIVLAYGEQDPLAPTSVMDKLRTAVSPATQVKTVVSPTSGHLERLIARLEKPLELAIDECLGASPAVDVRANREPGERLIGK